MTAVSGQVKRPAGGRPAEEQGLLSQEKLSGQEQLDRLSGMNLNSKEAEALLKAIYDAKNDDGAVAEINKLTEVEPPRLDKLVTEAINWRVARDAHRSYFHFAHYGDTVHSKMAKTYLEYIQNNHADIKAVTNWGMGKLGLLGYQPYVISYTPNHITMSQSISGNQDPQSSLRQEQDSNTIWPRSTSKGHDDDLSMLSRNQNASYLPNNNPTTTTTTNTTPAGDSQLTTNAAPTSNSSKVFSDAKNICAKLYANQKIGNGRGLYLSAHLKLERAFFTKYEGGVADRDAVISDINAILALAPLDMNSKIDDGYPEGFYNKCKLRNQTFQNQLPIIQACIRNYQFNFHYHNCTTLNGGGNVDRVAYITEHLKLERAFFEKYADGLNGGHPKQQFIHDLDMVKDLAPPKDDNNLDGNYIREFYDRGASTFWHKNDCRGCLPIMLVHYKDYFKENTDLVLLAVTDLIKAGDNLSVRSILNDFADEVGGQAKPIIYEQFNEHMRYGNYIFARDVLADFATEIGEDGIRNAVNKFNSFLHAGDYAEAKKVLDNFASYIGNQDKSNITNSIVTKFNQFLQGENYGQAKKVLDNFASYIGEQGMCNITNNIVTKFNNFLENGHYNNAVAVLNSFNADAVLEPAKQAVISVFDRCVAINNYHQALFLLTSFNNNDIVGSKIKTGLIEYIKGLDNQQIENFLLYVIKNDLRSNSKIIVEILKSCMGNLGSETCINILDQLVSIKNLSYAMETSIQDCYIALQMVHDEFADVKERVEQLFIQLSRYCDRHSRFNFIAKEKLDSNPLKLAHNLIEVESFFQKYALINKDGWSIDVIKNFSRDCDNLIDVNSNLKDKLSVNDFYQRCAADKDERSRYCLLQILKKCKDHFGDGLNKHIVALINRGERMYDNQFIVDVLTEFQANLQANNDQDNPVISAFNYLVGHGEHAMAGQVIDLFKALFKQEFTDEKLEQFFLKFSLVNIKNGSEYVDAASKGYKSGFSYAGNICFEQGIAQLEPKKIGHIDNMKADVRVIKITDLTGEDYYVQNLGGNKYKQLRIKEQYNKSTVEELNALAVADKYAEVFDGYNSLLGVNHHIPTFALENSSVFIEYLAHFKDNLSADNCEKIVTTLVEHCLKVDAENYHTAFNDAIKALTIISGVVNKEIVGQLFIKLVQNAYKMTGAVRDDVRELLRVNKFGLDEKTNQSLMLTELFMQKYMAVECEHGYIYDGDLPGGEIDTVSRKFIIKLDRDKIKKNGAVTPVSAKIISIKFSNGEERYVYQCGKGFAELPLYFRYRLVGKGFNDGYTKPVTKEQIEEKVKNGDVIFDVDNTKIMQLGNLELCTKDYDKLKELGVNIRDFYSLCLSLINNGNSYDHACDLLSAYRDCFIDVDVDEATNTNNQALLNGQIIELLRLGQTPLWSDRQANPEFIVKVLKTFQRELKNDPNCRTIVINVVKFLFQYQSNKYLPEVMELVDIFIDQLDDELINNIFSKHINGGWENGEAILNLLENHIDKLSANNCIALVTYVVEEYIKNMYARSINSGYDPAVSPKKHFKILTMLYNSMTRRGENLVIAQELFVKLIRSCHMFHETQRVAESELSCNELKLNSYMVARESLFLKYSEKEGKTSTDIADFRYDLENFVDLYAPLLADGSRDKTFIQEFYKECLKYATNDFKYNYLFEVLRIYRQDFGDVLNEHILGLIKIGQNIENDIFKSTFIIDVLKEFQADLKDDVGSDNCIINAFKDFMNTREYNSALEILNVFIERTNETSLDNSSLKQFPQTVNVLINSIVNKFEGLIYSYNYTDAQTIFRIFNGKIDSKLTTGIIKKFNSCIDIKVVSHEMADALLSQFSSLFNSEDITKFLVACSGITKNPSGGYIANDRPRVGRAVELLGKYSGKLSQQQHKEVISTYINGVIQMGDIKYIMSAFTMLQKFGNKLDVADAQSLLIKLIEFCINFYIVDPHPLLIKLAESGLQSNQFQLSNEKLQDLRNRLYNASGAYSPQTPDVGLNNLNAGSNIPDTASGQLRPLRADELENMEKAMNQQTYAGAKALVYLIHNVFPNSKINGMPFNVTIGDNGIPYASAEKKYGNVFLTRSAHDGTSYMKYLRLTESAYCYPDLKNKQHFYVKKKLEFFADGRDVSLENDLGCDEAQQLRDKIRNDLGHRYYMVTVNDGKYSYQLITKKEYERAEKSNNHSYY